jgi:hypothetical protein
MKRLVHLTLPLILVLTISQHLIADDAPLAPSKQRDPEATFRKACSNFVALEPKSEILKGVGETKPVVDNDDKKQLKDARLIFEVNAIPPGKGPAKAKDASKPFVYVSIQVWAGFSQQPAGDMHQFQWQGKDYQMWVRVFASDDKLAKTIRTALDVTALEPPVEKK